MATVRVLVLTGYGINCDFETEYAFNLCGARAERVHINSLINKEKSLKDYQILAFPGGFSFGDDIASGKVLAVRLKVNLWEEIAKFIEMGNLVIGICNGFQVMAKFGLLSDLPALEAKQRFTVTYNDSGRFEDRWVYLKRESKKCVWLEGIDGLYLPVAHGEGKVYAEEEVLDTLEKNDQIAFRYALSDLKPANSSYPFNPNGSLRDIAGVCDPSGRLLGMMPHPERYTELVNHPNWTMIKEATRREKMKIFWEGEGLRIFKNGIFYFK